MIEYDQAVVRLGLRKNEAQAELDRLRSEVTEISSRRTTLIGEISDAETKLQAIRQEVIDAVRTSSEEVAGLSRAQHKSGQALNEKTKELKKLEDYLVSLQVKVVAENGILDMVNEKVKEAREVLSTVKQGLNEVIIEKQSVEEDIISLQEVKKEIGGVIAASEEKLSYLSEKEQFLNRKEADLIKYEERVEKMRKDAGNEIKMTFN